MIHCNACRVTFLAWLQKTCNARSCDDSLEPRDGQGMSRLIIQSKHIVTAQARSQSPSQLSGAGQPDLSSPALCYHNNGRLGGILRKDPHNSGSSVHQPPHPHWQCCRDGEMPKEILGKADKVIKPTWLRGNISYFHLFPVSDLTLTRHSSAVPWGFTLSGGRDQGLTVKVVIIIIIIIIMIIMIIIITGRMCPPWLCSRQLRPPEQGLYLDNIRSRGKHNCLC